MSRIPTIASWKRSIIKLPGSIRQRVVISSPPQEDLRLESEPCQAQPAHVVQLKAKPRETALDVIVD